MRPIPSQRASTVSRKRVAIKLSGQEIPFNTSPISAVPPISKRRSPIVRMATRYAPAAGSPIIESASHPARVLG